MLDKLKSVETKESLVEVIINQFEELVKGDYMPAIIKDGELSSESENSEDFYLKLVIVPKDTIIEETWLQGNLNMTDTFYEKELLAYNLVVYKNFKHEKIYQYNPQLFNDEEIWETDQTSLVFAQQNIEDSKSYETIPVFQFEEKNKKEILYINSKVLDRLNFFTPYTPDFELCLEFEYRFSGDMDRLKSEETTLTNDSYRGFITISNNRDRKNKMMERGFTHVQGTIVINIDEILTKTKTKNKISEIKVVNLDDSLIRNLNKNNYNDDTNAGLVVFSKECIDILKEEYHYNGLSLIPKRTEQRGVLIDILDDIVVFWEGEFNKFPKEIQDQLLAYNLIDRTENIISKFMYTWQLEANFKFMESALPNQQLGSYTYEHYNNKAISNNLEFWEPETVRELKIFIDKVNSVLEVKPYTFNKNLQDIKLLEKIRTESFSGKLNVGELKMLMQKYCFAVLKYLEENSKHEGN